MNTKFLGALVVAIGAATMLTAGMGCMVRASAAPPAPEPVYVTADVVPVNIETYPAVEYEGHPTYYVGGRWYHRQQGAWVYYRNEPSGLAQRHPVQQEHQEEKREEKHEDKHEDHRGGDDHRR